MPLTACAIAGFMSQIFDYMAAANRYLREHYRPAFDAESMQPAMEESNAFVACIALRSMTWASASSDRRPR